jgi:UDP:flavonoid glycosyltransferase YjiC (YdhE family)
MLHGGSAHRSRAALLDAAVGLFPEVGPRVIGHCDRADAVLSSETLHLLGRSIADWRRVPHVALCLVPYGRTDCYPSFYADTPELRALGNAASHELVERHHHERLLPAVNPVRTGLLGLPELDLRSAYRGREECPAVLGYSPAVFPPPSDWPIHRDVTGYWRLPHGAETIDPGLRRFVEDGTPPVYVGFGSMDYDPARLAPLLRAVVRETGVRLVYAAGWLKEDRVRAHEWPDDIFVTAGAPHGWLFPRVLGAVHHGGAGTTAAAVTAGVPSLIAWFIVDQVFWAGRVTELGVGVDLGNFHALTADALVAAVGRLVGDRALGDNAGRLGRKVGEEDGVGRAVRAIGRHLGNARLPAAVSRG